MERSSQFRHLRSMPRGFYNLQLRNIKYKYRKGNGVVLWIKSINLKSRSPAAASPPEPKKNAPWHSTKHTQDQWNAAWALCIAHIMITGRSILHVRNDIAHKWSRVQASQKISTRTEASWTAHVHERVRQTLVLVATISSWHGISAKISTGIPSALCDCHHTWLGIRR